MWRHLCFSQCGSDSVSSTSGVVIWICTFHGKSIVISCTSAHSDFSRPRGLAGKSQEKVRLKFQLRSNLPSVNVTTTSTWSRVLLVLLLKRLRNRPRLRDDIYQIWWIWETEADTWRLQKPTVQSETFNHAASSLCTFRLCTTYTKPQPAAAGLTAGRPETHKNAQSLKAALSVTHGPAECQRGSSRPPHRRWRISTVAAPRDGTPHPKKPAADVSGRFNRVNKPRTKGWLISLFASKQEIEEISYYSWCLWHLLD